MIRTEEENRAGLGDGREIWIDGEQAGRHGPSRVQLIGGLVGFIFSPILRQPALCGQAEYSAEDILKRVCEFRTRCGPLSTKVLGPDVLEISLERHVPGRGSGLPVVGPFRCSRLW